MTARCPAPASAHMHRQALGELDLAERVAEPGAGGRDGVRRGGTPTLLPAADLAAVLRGIHDRFGLASGAEVTTEANPDSVSGRGRSRRWRRAASPGSASGCRARYPILRTHDRTHDPANVARAVGWARDAGLDVSLDLIYGTQEVAGRLAAKPRHRRRPRT